MGARIQEVTQQLDATVAVIDAELDRRVERVRESLLATSRHRDELERMIDELADEGVRREMRRCLAEMDDGLERALEATGDVNAFDLYDPIRVISADLKVEAAQFPLG